MKQFGMQGQEGLDEAEDAMKEAENELGKGEQGRGKAIEQEGKAIDGLRKGAQSLAQQMQQQGQEPGEGEQAGGPGNPRDGQPREHRPNANSDPLGRETHDRRDNNRQLYDPLGAPAAQRAQKVLEELRKRLGEQFRPREELDYLERLLKRY
jgi:F0F1-type ATP synthase membrane subunit b/b'